MLCHPNGKVLPVPLAVACSPNKFPNARNCAQAPGANGGSRCTAPAAPPPALPTNDGVAKAGAQPIRPRGSFPTASQQPHAAALFAPLSHAAQEGAIRPAASPPPRSGYSPPCRCCCCWPRTRCSAAAWPPAAWPSCPQRWCGWPQRSRRRPRS